MRGAICRLLFAVLRAGSSSSVPSPPVVAVCVPDRLFMPAIYFPTWTGCLKLRALYAAASALVPTKQMPQITSKTSEGRWGGGYGRSERRAVACKSQTIKKSMFQKRGCSTEVPCYCQGCAAQPSLFQFVKFPIL